MSAQTLESPKSRSSQARYSELIGEAPSMKATHRLIERISTSTVRTVLIYGETGTGKGMVARKIHQLSSRKNQNFLDLNCAAIPGTLLETELFGHQKGAFTGATESKKGLIETADRGTVFLDEIREMDLALQAKLLGVLDMQQFRPIGAVRPVTVDVRFVAATNKSLYDEVRAGKFREDLYYRLQVVVINLPPLRDRGNDIFLLIDHFVDTFCRRYGRVIRGCEPAVEEIFKAYSWPGNVRELENLIERIFLLEDEDRILVKHLPLRILREFDNSHVKAAVAALGNDSHDLAGVTECLSRLRSGELGFDAATETFQRALILQALDRSRGRKETAAKFLGLSRHSLRYYMGKLNIE